MKNEKNLVKLLKENNMIITTAESCTAGMIASQIVNVPGASSVFKQGYITYCDMAKNTMLGVKNETLEKYYAVSCQVASEMAEGAAFKASADVALSVTGVAGPDMEDGKPVGLVYIGCSVKGNVNVIECNFSGDRKKIRQSAADKAIDFACDMIMKYVGTTFLK